MNTRSLGILIGLTVVVIVLAAVFQTSRQSAVQSKNDQTKLFPELLPAINDVATVHVQRKDGEATLKRSGEAWGLVEKDGYSVDLEPMRKALLAVADMTRIEAKTSDPARYATLGVQDPDADASTSTLVTLSDASGKELAKLIVGKPHQGKAGTAGQLYVRRADEAQSWLVKSDLSLFEKSTDWLAKRIVEVKRDRVRAVEVTHPDGEIVRIDRANPETTDFTLANIPEGRELKHATVASSMSSTLEWLNLEDVARAETIDFTTTPGATCRFWCFDGLVITVTLKEDGEKTYARFVASYEAPPASEAPAAEPKPEGESTEAQAPPEKLPTKTPEEVQAEVAELNARLAKWVYVIPSYNKTTFAKRMNDLLKDQAPPPAATPIDDSSLGDEDNKDAYVIPGHLPPEIQQQIREHQESLGNKVIVGPAPKPDEAPDQDPKPEPPH